MSTVFEGLLGVTAALGRWLVNSSICMLQFGLCSMYFIVVANLLVGAAGSIQAVLALGLSGSAEEDPRDPRTGESGSSGTVEALVLGLLQSFVWALAPQGGAHGPGLSQEHYDLAIASNHPVRYLAQAHAHHSQITVDVSNHSDPIHTNHTHAPTNHTILSNYTVISPRTNQTVHVNASTNISDLMQVHRIGDSRVHRIGDSNSSDSIIDAHGAAATEYAFPNVTTVNVTTVTSNGTHHNITSFGPVPINSTGIEDFEAFPNPAWFPKHAIALMVISFFLMSPLSWVRNVKGLAIFNIIADVLILISLVLLFGMESLLIEYGGFGRFEPGLIGGPTATDTDVDSLWDFPYVNDNLADIMTCFNFFLDVRFPYRMSTWRIL